MDGKQSRGFRVNKHTIELDRQLTQAAIVQETHSVNATSYFGPCREQTYTMSVAAPFAIS